MEIQKYVKTEADLKTIPRLTQAQVCARWDDFDKAMVYEISQSMIEEMPTSATNQSLLSNPAMVNNGFLPHDVTKPTADQKFDAFNAFRLYLIGAIKEQAFELTRTCETTANITVIMFGRWSYLQPLFGIVVDRSFAKAAITAAFDDRANNLMSNDARREKVSARLQWYRECLREKVVIGDVAAIRAATEIETFESKLYGLSKQADDTSLAELVAMAQQSFIERKRAALGLSQGVIEAEPIASVTVEVASE